MQAAAPRGNLVVSVQGWLEDTGRVSSINNGLLSYIHAFHLVVTDCFTLYRCLLHDSGAQQVSGSHVCLAFSGSFNRQSKCFSEQDLQWTCKRALHKHWAKRAYVMLIHETMIAFMKGCYKKRAFTIISGWGWVTPDDMMSVGHSVNVTPCWVF